MSKPMWYQIVRIDWAKDSTMSEELMDAIVAADEDPEHKGMDLKDFGVVSHSQDGDGITVILGAEYRR